MDNADSMYLYLKLNRDAVSYRSRANTVSLPIRMSKEICPLGEMEMPIIYWLTFPTTTRKKFSTRNSSILMISLSVGFLLINAASQN